MPKKVLHLLLIQVVVLFMGLLAPSQVNARPVSVAEADGGGGSTVAKTCGYSLKNPGNTNITYTISFDSTGRVIKIIRETSHPLSDGPDDKPSLSNVTSSYQVQFTKCVAYIQIDGSTMKPSDSGNYVLTTFNDTGIQPGDYPDGTPDEDEENWTGIFDGDMDRGSFLDFSRVSCGNELIRNIPTIIPRISSSIYNLVMVIVPVLLVIFGMLDLVKGIMSQKEDEMRKGRSAFIKRTIIGLLTFLVVLLTKLLLGLVGGHGNVSRIVGCVDCFVSGVDSCGSNDAEDSMEEYSSQEVA